MSPTRRSCILYLTATSRSPSPGCATACLLSSPVETLSLILRTYNWQVGIQLILIVWLETEECKGKRNMGFQINNLD